MALPRRDEFTLTALADTLVVDLEAGMQDASTTLEYTKNAEWTILHRILGDDWIGVPLPIVGLDDPHLIRGDFETLPLRPGQMYEACIVPPDFMPDSGTSMHEFVFPFDGGESAPASVSVVAVRKRPEPRTFYSDGNSSTHGTYHERDVLANTDVFAQLSVSSQPWVDAGDGLLVMPGPKQVVARGPQQTFHLVVDDLLPGMPYYELLMLMDEFGNWEFRPDSITTLRRKVEVEVTELFISDDSDDLSTGEGTFTFSVSAATEALASSNTVTYPNTTIDSGHHVALPNPVGTCVLGPTTVMPDTKRLFYWAGCYEDDSGSFPPDGDDYASGHKELRIPIGPGENVHGATDSIEISDSGLAFRVGYKYSIHYE